jgi:hypothetical protein
MVLLLILYPTRRFIAVAVQPLPSSLGDLASVYKQLLRSFRGARTYAYVLLNSIFHSGVFTWLGLYLEREHGLGPAAIGLACWVMAFPASSLARSSAAWPTAWGGRD